MRLGSTLLSVGPIYASSAVIGLWIAICVWVSFTADFASCDNSMHLAALVASAEGLKQGNLWPYIPELHFGWSTYGMYCWPLFFLGGCCMNFLEWMGHSNPLLTTFLLGLVTPMALLPIVATWTGAWVSRAIGSPNQQRDRLGAIGGLVGSLAFLLNANDTHFGYGINSLRIGIIAQTWGWVFMVGCIGSWYAMFKADKRSDILTRVLLFALCSTALFCVHNLSTLTIALLLGIAAIFKYTYWRRVAIAAAVCLLLGMWYISIFIQHGSTGLPVPYSHDDRTLLSGLFIMAWLNVSSFLLLQATTHLVVIVSLGAFIWHGRRHEALKPLLWGCGVLFLVIIYDEVAEAIPLYSHWYRSFAHIVLLGAVIGGTLLALSIGPHVKTYRERLVFAVLAVLLAAVLPPWVTTPNPSAYARTATTTYTDWMEAVGALREDRPGARFASSAWSIAGNHPNHNNAFVAVAMDYDLAAGAQTTLCGPAYHWHSLALNEFGYPRHAMPLANYKDFSAQEKMFALRETGINGVVYDSSLHEMETLKETTDESQAWFVDTQEYGDVRVGFFPDPVPLITPITAPLLSAPEELPDLAQWALSLWAFNHRAAEEADPRRIVYSETPDILPSGGPYEQYRFEIREHASGELYHTSAFMNSFQVQTAYTLPSKHKKIQLHNTAKRLDDTMPASSKEYAVPTHQPSIVASSTGLSISNCIPGQPYYVRYAHNPYWEADDAAIYPEVSGFMVVTPESSEAFLAFRPLKTSFTIFLIMAGTTLTFALGAICWYRKKND